MSNVRLVPLWTAILARLNTADARAVMRGDRTFLAHEDYGTKTGPEGEPWGRQVVMPPSGLAGVLWDEVAAGTHRAVSFNLLTEMNDYTAPGYNVAVALEQLQDLGYTQLQEWNPGPLPLADPIVLPTLALHRVRSPQPVPEWDEATNMWWMSSAWRCEAARVMALT
ncbi:MAG TPA: hypothetical protein VLD58_12360 [Gemmatimonadales bacterium]|nr:hypothetical protein [Gemmatimonadales bacterium]